MLRITVTFLPVLRPELADFYGVRFMGGSELIERNAWAYQPLLSIFRSCGYLVEAAQPLHEGPTDIH